MCDSSKNVNASSCIAIAARKKKNEKQKNKCYQPHTQQIAICRSAIIVYIALLQSFQLAFPSGDILLRAWNCYKPIDNNKQCLQSKSVGGLLPILIQIWIRLGQWQQLFVSQYQLKTGKRKRNMCVCVCLYKNNTNEMALSVRKWDANDACEVALEQSIQNEITNRFNKHNTRHQYTVTWIAEVPMRPFIHGNSHIL